MNNALSNGNPQEPPQQAGVIVAEHIRDVTVHAEVLDCCPIRLPPGFALISPNMPQVPSMAPWPPLMWVRTPKR
ncbi:hypothetical protein [Rhizobium ruizarguesonis]|uniref:hypothetical protein n=1 Tax=Rhizobium ruizarguesonis TaxID=2081791 RepID=UPI001FDFDF27|nr:hypothetical protein [Rhizobium ruizarguesonis]